MKRLTVTLVFLVLVAAGAVLGMRAIAAGAPEPPRVEKEVERTLRVTTQVLTMSQPARHWRGTGRLAARKRVPLSSEEGGRLSWVLESWRAGTEVRTGTPLWKIEDVDLRLAEKGVEARRTVLKAQKASAEQAEARSQRLAALETERLAVQEAEQDRWQRLVDEGQGTQSSLDLARNQTLAARRALIDAEESGKSAALQAATLDAQIEQLDVELAVLRVRLGRLEQTAPGEGWIAGDPPAPGQWVMPGQTLGTLIDNSPPRILVEVGERELARIPVGVNARVYWPGDSKPHPAKLKVQGTQVESSTGEITVEFDLTGEPPAWRPGLSVEVELVGQSFAKGLWLRSEHVIWRAGKPGCFALRSTDEGPFARFVELELGPETGGLYPVRGGMPAGSTLITGPLSRLFDGAPVSVEGQP